MAATIVTISEVGGDGAIEIKVKDGHPIPSAVVTDEVRSFRSWRTNEDYVFAWTTDSGHEKAMHVSKDSIAWVLSTQPVETAGGDKFRIDNPCTVDISPEE